MSLLTAGRVRQIEAGGFKETNMEDETCLQPDLKDYQQTCIIAMQENANLRFKNETFKVNNNFETDSRVEMLKNLKPGELIYVVLQFERDEDTDFHLELPPHVNKWSTTLVPCWFLQFDRDEDTDFALVWFPSAARNETDDVELARVPKRNIACSLFKSEVFRQFEHWFWVRAVAEQIVFFDEYYDYETNFEDMEQYKKLKAEKPRSPLKCLKTLDECLAESEGFTKIALLIWKADWMTGTFENVLGFQKGYSRETLKTEGRALLKFRNMQHLPWGNPSEPDNWSMPSEEADMQATIYEAEGHDPTYWHIN
jgi:hypothetical protein